MTNFIDRLTKEEMDNLLDQLSFKPYCDGFRKGTHSYSEDGYKVYHTWDHDYSSSKDYDDEYMCISDFDVKRWGNCGQLDKILYSFMLKKFSDEWANKAVKYFTGKKAVNKVKIVENMLKNLKYESQNVENNI